MMSDYDFENILKAQVTQLIEANIQTEIEESVKNFAKTLLDRKDQYIAEIMKGIRIIHQQEPCTRNMNYKIIFENVERLERND